MDEKSIGEEFRAMANKARPGPDCLDEYDLANVAACEMGSQSRTHYEKHLSDCPHCLGKVTELMAINDISDEYTVSGTTLRRAQELVRHPPLTRRISRWATAAVVVLAFGLAFQTGVDRSKVETVSPVTTTTYRQSRSTGEMDVRPTINQPVEGSQLKVAGAEIEWTKVAGSLYYDVRVVSRDGELVGRQRVAQNHWSVPAGMLQPGDEYYVRVDAYLAEAKRLSSHHVLFTVEQP